MSDRAFPYLTGLGVAIALAAMPWVPKYRAGIFMVVAIAIAVPLGTLRIRDGHLSWLGAEYRVASFLAAVFASFTTIVVTVFIWRQDWLALPNILDEPAILAVIILVGILSTWFASVLRRWLDPQRTTVSPTGPRWSPRSWGLAGITGGTLTIIAAIALTSIAIQYPKLPTLGPTRIGLWFVGTAFGAVLLVGLCFLAVEAGSRRLRTSNSSRLP